MVDGRIGLRIELDKTLGKVFLHHMNAAVAIGRIPDIELEAHETVKRQTLAWLDSMDRMLDIHRANFVFRQATAAELEQHKTGLKFAIRTSHLINTLVEDPDFNEPELVSRLKVRIQQLKDAYNTFHDSELSEEKAEEILKEVFPE